MTYPASQETPTFPLDWNEWRKQWDEWKAAHASDLRPTSFRFPSKNMLADEILGTWSINGRNVELSEVTFPNLSDRDENGNLIRGERRYIGITYGTGTMTDTPDNPVVPTFADLERELGIRAETVES